MLSIVRQIKSITKIQALVRGKIVRKTILIPSSKYQTKIWRKNQVWYKNGKSNECEIQQLELINKITGKVHERTFDRINISDYSIKHNPNPMVNNCGYEWTEDFDGKLNIDNKQIYFNLKFVCGKGGSQTRTLREVYHFINCQINNLQLNSNKNVYFINILEGDEAYRHRDKFIYLLNKSSFNKNIFIGDMNEFQNYWKSFKN
jgi:hypothetical protein